MRKNTFISALFVLIFMQLGHTQLSLNCENDSSGLIPLTDLATGYYEGIQGGLYPGGNNQMPIIHQQKGLLISQTIEPLNVDGDVDYENGEILFIGMGGSNAANAYNMFIDTMKNYDWQGTNPCMEVKGLFFGGKDLHDMIDTTSTFYWDELQGRLFNRNDTWEQIQVIWMLEQSEIDTTDVPYYVDYVADQYTQLMHVLIDSMPNLKIVYLTGFHYTGYTHPDHELYDYLVEPKGYWGNLAIKEVIERQINGDTLLTFEGPDRKAPFISWGPYFWADGENPRGEDFLTWPCEDYRDDATGGGFHLEELGKYKEAKLLMKFYNGDTLANWWYKNDARWSACEETGALEKHINSEPEMLRQNIRVDFDESAQSISIDFPKIKHAANCTLYNAEGEKILTQIINTQKSTHYQMQIEDFPQGMYVFVLESENGPLTGNFYLKN